MNEGKLDFKVENPSSHDKATISSSKQLESQQSNAANLNSLEINCLNPVKLLTIPLDFNKIKVNALIDTGANLSLIRKSELNTIGSEHNELTSSQIISGLGESKIQVSGSTTLTPLFFNLPMTHVFQIVNDTDINFPIILGTDFLKKHNFSVNLAKGIISKKEVDDSFIDFYLDDDNKIKQVIHEGIPVYCSKQVTIPANESVRVPVNINLAYSDIIKDSSEKFNLLYYEGESKRNNIECINGILDQETSDKFVYMNTTKEYTCKQTIKKNEKVGTVSTILVVDADDNTEEDEWNSDRIKQDIILQDNLTAEQKLLVYDMLNKTVKVLSKNDSDVGLAKIAPHTIELTDKTPIWQKARVFADPVNKEIEEQCQELLSLDIIEHSDSRWSSPVVPVRKSDSQLRLCIDYRKVNSVTKTEHFPMPNLNHCIYKAHNIKYLTKLDIVRGYYHVPLDEDSRPYTAFSTTKNHFQFKRLSFGLKNSGIAFQKALQQILFPFNSNNIIIYIDDILILSETFEQHLSLVQKVLNTLHGNGLKIKVKKCEFFRDEVSYLGHIINQQGIRKSPEYVEKVKEYPRPTNVNQLRKFLGLINFQRKFVQNCSTIAKPLSKLTNGPKRRLIKWNTEEVEAFEKLKLEIEREVSLSYPNYDKDANKLELFVDASGTGAGACLMQFQGGEYRVISYASMCFTPAQARYCTTERELTAIRWAVKVFKPFIYGVHFILYTDHRPLIYLNNMASHKSRLSRTLDDLIEYNFDIRYRPGRQNQAADFLSRLDQPELQLEIHNMDSNYKQVPKGLKLIEIVEGGGDSLFQSLIIVMKEGIDDYPETYPHDHLQLRKILVDELIINLDKYKLKLNNKEIKQMKVLYNPGQLPCPEILLAASHIFNLDIHVHHGIASPVIYRSSIHASPVTVHLQCISMIHYNPLFELRSYQQEISLNDKCINSIDEIEQENNEELIEADITDDEYNDETMVDQTHLVQLAKCKLICTHSLNSLSSSVVEVNNCNYCCILDTGAQVSLVAKSVVDSLLKDDLQVELKDSQDILVGLGNHQSKIIGIVMLKMKILSVEINTESPFAVVDDSCIPCCFLLGSNFIKENNIQINFAKGEIKIIHDNEERIQQMTWKNNEQTDTNNSSISDELSFLGVVDIDHFYESPLSENDQVEVRQQLCNDESIEVESDEVLDTEIEIINITPEREESNPDDQRETEHDSVTSEDDDSNYIAKFTISTDEMKLMQDRNYAIHNLKNNIRKQIPIKQWRQRSLNQFKRSASKLTVRDGLLMHEYNSKVLVVVTFPFLVEIIHKVHTQLAHIGRHKLLDIIQDQFYHPALNKVAKDYCSSCRHCQLFKVNAQPISPPVLKIQTSKPFELMAVDLLQFPKSSKGNIAALVAVDHYSKWLIAIPLRNKTAITVTRALQHQILPHIPRIPDRILSDNGPEFASNIFNEALKEHKIEHTYSTPFTPASNGAVERMNKTVIELLKGISDEHAQWDEQLSKVILTYNHSYHSQIRTTPSKCLLNQAHTLHDRLPVDQDTIETWRQGHPNFTAFKINQKVIKKINRIGNRVQYKLKQKFEGPYLITKVQSNKVTYEISDIDNPELVIAKVHHKQLRAYKEIPFYIKRYLYNEKLLKLKHLIILQKMR